MPYKDPERQKAAARKHYDGHKEVMKARARAYNSKQRQVLRKLIAKAKDVPCAECGDYYEGESYLMDFDHVRGKKEGNIADMVGRAVSVQKAQEEIAKCDVICVVCHRRRTHQ